MGKKKMFKRNFVSSGLNMVHGTQEDNILASMHNDLNDQGDTLNAKRSSELGSRAGSSYAKQDHLDKKGSSSGHKKINLSA